jgi:DNA-binding IclR family transcriptional regulator
VQILNCFSFEKRELSVSEIAARTKLHKATVHRILWALEHNRLIRQSPETGRCFLGMKLFELGQQAIARLDLREIARPHLEKLSQETRETVHLAILDDNQVLYLEKVEGPHALRMPSRVGRHIPTYCTSLGKAMLACLDDDEVRRILQDENFEAHTPSTVKNISALLSDLEKIRRRGYAVDNEEIERGLRCIGAALKDYTGQMVGAISIAAPSARLTDKILPSLGRRVVVSADAISRELGYTQVALRAK